jgi:hypothetical protein
MTTQPSRPPKGLGTRGRGFWKTVTSGYELDPAETELLVEVARLLDQCEQLQGVLDRDGLTIAGSTGQTRIHPGVGELRACRTVLGRLLAQLDLPDPEGDTLATPTQARARKAARTRWDRTAALREIRRNGA